MAFQKGHGGIVNGKPLRTKESYAKLGKHLSVLYAGRTEFAKNLGTGMLGKRHKESTKLKISVIASRQKGKPKPWMRGEGNSQWMGGVSPANKIARRSVEYKNWRNSVYKRDMWTCRRCKTNGGRLHPHHRKMFSKHPESRYDVENGVTLCEPCHRTVHKKKVKKWLCGHCIMAQ